MPKTSLTVLPKSNKATPAPNKQGGAKLNTDGSVVDYIKSTGGDASFTSRANLAVEQGIVRDKSQYRGTAEQNTSLLTRLRSGSASSPNRVANQNDASNFINAGQDDDIAAAEAEDAPDSRGGGTTDLVDAFKSITGRDQLLPNYNVEAPDFSESYEKMRQQFDVSDLEQSINELDAQEQEIQARLRERTNAEMDKTVAMNVISGRVGEAERQEMERLDFIGRQKQRAVNELQTANNVIETKMNLMKMDYDVAKSQYDTEFKQSVQMFNMIKGVAEFEISEEERQMENSRANLQIMYNSIKDGGMDVANLDPDTETRLRSLELKSGLPQGFYNSVARANPDSKVLSTTTRESGGTKYADVITRATDGSISTQTISLGSVTASGGGSDSDDSDQIEDFRSDASDFIQKLETREIGWAGAFNALKAKYPMASNELIDQTLNKEKYYDREI